MLNKILNFFGYSLIKVQPKPLAFYSFTVDNNENVTMESDFNGDNGIKALAYLLYSINSGENYASMCALALKHADNKQFEMFLNTSKQCVSTSYSSNQNNHNDEEDVVDPMNVLKRGNE